MNAQVIDFFQQVLSTGEPLVNLESELRRRRSRT